MNINLLKTQLLLLLLPLFTVAQVGTGSLKGRVTTADGQPAEYMSVHIKENRFGDNTNSRGEFRFGRVKAGTYTVRVAGIGVAAQEKSVTVSAGAETVVDFVLTETSQRLQEVTISSKKKSAYKTDQPSQSLRLTTPLIEAPQNIQVVSGQALADQQIISMSDNLIRNVSGATRLEHWGDLYTNITMRGTQIQAFRNGFNVVASYWGPLTEDMSFVDHIEFVKGPAGFMLSNGDPSGMYNVVTKKPTGITKGEASLTLGSFDLYRATLDLDGKLSNDGKLLYRLNVAGQNKASHRAYEFNDRYSVAPVISYQVDDQTKITAEYTYQKAKMSDVGSYYVFQKDGYAGMPVDFTMYAPGLAPTNINDHSLFLTLDHKLNDNWKLTAQASYFNYSQVGSSMWPSTVNADGTVIRAVGIWDAKSTMALGQVFLNGNVSTGAIHHRILAGLDAGKKNYFADWIDTQELDLVSDPFDPKNPDYGTPSAGWPVFDRSLNLEARAVAGGGLIDQRYTGIYLQDELGFFENKFRLTLAGRYTFVSQSAWGDAAQEAKHFSPRIGASVSIDKQTSVYGLYDQAFTPQSGKLANGGSIKPITGNNIEFGIKKDWFDGKWNTTIAAYRILKENELTADPNSAPALGLSVVLGQKRAQGIEFDMRGEILPGFNLIANYAYTDATVTKVTAGVPDISVGDVVPGFSKHIVNTWLAYRVSAGALKGVGISAGFSFQGDRATDTWSDTNLRLPNYFRLDGGLSWQKDKITLTGNVFNILNKYLYSGSYYKWLDAFNYQTEAPRNLRFSVAYKF